MQRRTHESPMDFQWESGSGRMDPTSPFSQLTQSQQNQGFRSGFQTPSKPFATPSKPSFSSAAPIAPPFRNPSFQTPRKPFDPDLYSEASGAESSPAEGADTEDTPDPPKFSQALAAMPSSKSTKKPIFGRYGHNFAGHSPGRGDIRRSKFAEPIANKVRKRKRIDRDYALISGRRSSYEEDSDSDDSQPRAGGKVRVNGNDVQQLGWFAGILNGIESRPSLPHILSHYAQTILNYFIALVFVWGVWVVVSAIRADIDVRAQEEISKAHSVIAECAKNYLENRCKHDTRLPALNEACNNWGVCMNRDAAQLGRAKVGAFTFGEILTNFFEPVSYKAVACLALMFFGAIAIPNVAFRSSSTKHYPASAPPPQPQYYSHQQHQDIQWHPIPQTPRHLSNPGQSEMFPPVMPSGTPSGRRSPSKSSRDSPKKLMW